VGSPLRSLRSIGKRLSSDSARRCKFTDPLFSSANMQLQNNLFLRNPASIQFPDEILAVLAIGVAYCMGERDADLASKPSLASALGVTPEKKNSKEKMYTDFKVKDSKKLEQHLLEIFSSLEESKVRVGDQVEVISSLWMAGIASSEQGNDTFCVEYYDGRVEEYVHEDRIRKNHSLCKSPGFICSKQGVCTSSFRNKYFRHLTEAARRLQKQSKYPNQKGKEFYIEYPEQ
jgi:hypothetical protein